MMFKKIIGNWKSTILWGLLILALGAFLRLVNLTIIPVFADEAIYIRWSQIMANEPTLRFLPLSDGKQPLFMWILMFFVNRISDPLFAGRLVSVFSGILGIFGIFFLSYIISRSKKASLVASLMWTIAPFSVFYDRVALVDSLLTTLGIFTMAFWILAVKNLRLDLAMISGFFLGFASLTKSPALFFALLMPVALIFAPWPKKKKLDYNFLLKLGFLLIASYLIAFGMYNIQRLGPNFHLLSSRTRDYVFPLERIITHPGDPIIANLQSSVTWLLLMGPAAILLKFSFSLYKNFKKRKKEFIYLLSWLLFPLVFQAAYAKSFIDRYILFTLPPIYIISSLSFKNRIFKVFLILFIFQAAWTNYLLLTDPLKAAIPRRLRSGFFEEWTSGVGIKEVSEYVKNEQVKDPASQIVVGTEGYFGTLPDGLQIYLQDTAGVVVKGVGVNISEIPTDLIESKEAGNKTYLVINKSRLLAKPDDLSLKLIAAYPKAFRESGTLEHETKGPQEVLYFFEVTDGTP